MADGFLFVKQAPFHLLAGLPEAGGRNLQGKLKPEDEFRTLVGFGTHGDGTVVLAHDLLGQAESDAGSLASRGKKRNEYFSLGLFIDARAIILDNDQSIVSVIPVSLQADYFILLLGKCLHGIFDEVDEYLLYQFRVQFKAEVLRFNGHFKSHFIFFQFPFEQNVYLIKEVFYFNQLEFWFRGMGQASEIIHKTDEAFAAALDGLDGQVDVFQVFSFDGTVFFFIPQVSGQIIFHGSGQRRNGRDRIHDLMGQYPHQLLPCFHFLFFQFCPDVL